MVLVPYSFNLFYLFEMEQLLGALWNRGVLLGEGQVGRDEYNIHP